MPDYVVHVAASGIKGFVISHDPNSNSSIYIHEKCPTREKAFCAILLCMKKK
jgi:hypothetical protein